MSQRQRDQLRRSLRSSRDALDVSSAYADSVAICEQVLPLLESVQHIAGYYALGKEVDLSSLHTACMNAGKHVYVPIVLPHHEMQFAPIDNDTIVECNRYGIKEPQLDSEHHVSAHQLDAVVVPLVGFDTQCNRMGMGGGYYDRCFAHRRRTAGAPLLIGVAFDLQRADDVHTEEWDVSLDMVVTPSRIYRKNSE